MRLITKTFRAPHKNLAYDETLLDGLERKRVPETLRFWESGVPFVVLGVGQALREQVYENNCREDKIPIMRRCSAGGTVVQGPGSLNYTLVLRHDNHPELKTIRGSYCHILGAITRAFANHGVEVTHQGVSDLALGNLKVSGNAQRRRKRGILHHGTLLYKPFDFDMKRYLIEPADRPKYRAKRKHDEFLTALPLDRNMLQQVVQEAFDVTGPPVQPTRWELNHASEEATEKYAANAWIRRR